jgi:hypothetical protein
MSDEYPYQFFQKLEDEFVDLKNPKAEKKFFNNSAFQVEFKFEPGEKILYLNYQNVKYVIGSIFLTLGTIAAILIATFLTIGFIEVLDWGFIGMLLTIIVGIMAFVGILISVITFVSASSYRYLITDRRLVMGYTLGQRWARSVNYSNILDLVVSQGPMGRLFHTGTLFIITGSNEGAMGASPAAAGGAQQAKQAMALAGFLNVKFPFRIKNLLSRIMHYYGETELARPQLNVDEMFEPKITNAQYIKLYPDEKVYKIYQRKMVSSLIPFLGMLVFGLVYGIQYIGEALIFLAEFTSLIIGLAIILGGLVVFLIVMSKYHAKGFEFVVTNRRIVIFKKFLSITCRDVIMGKICEVSIFQMMTGRMANFGTIKIGTKGFENMRMYIDLQAIQGVADAPKEKDEIMNVILHFQNGQLHSPMMEMYDPEYFSN